MIRSNLRIIFLFIQVLGGNQINDTDYIIDSVSMHYTLHSYLTFGNYNEYFYSDSVYVPFFNDKPIYGYNKIEWMYTYYQKWPILSERVGYEFQRYYDDGKRGDCGEHVMVMQKTIRNKDSIIILEGHWGICDLYLYLDYENKKRVSYQEYKKHVGLTYYYIIDTTTQDTIYKKALVDYFINK